MNHVTLTGNISQEIQLHTTGNDNSVTTIHIAVSSDYFKTGEEVKPDFIPVTAWGKLAETCAANLVKGQHVEVEGRLQRRSYDKDGEKRYVTEVIAEKVKFGAKPLPKEDTKKSKAKKSA